VSQPCAAEQYKALMARLQHIEAVRQFAREEMDEIFIVDKRGGLAYYKNNYLICFYGRRHANIFYCRT
jgi:hypothetical protein